MKKNGLIITLIALTFLGFVFLCMPALAETAATAPGNQDKEAKYKDIQELFVVIKLDESLHQIIDIMLNNFDNELLPIMDKNEVEAIKNKFKSKFKVEDVIRLVTPIYDKYLSTDDVKGLIVFYKTPLGQKMITVMPAMMNEAMQTGAKYGENIAIEILQEMATEKKKQDADKLKPADGKTPDAEKPKPADAK